MDWMCRSASLEVAGRSFKIHASPYTLPVNATAELVCAPTLEALKSLDCDGQILLLLGPIAHEPLMPKDYPFFFPEEHQIIISLLEEKRPSAILTATGRHPQLAGGVYPFPMIEDGNFNIPSAYLTDELGRDLARLQGNPAHLVLDVERVPSYGANLIASKPGHTGSGKLVICAHLDTKIATPGALDNAGGVCTLLSTAHKLNSYQDRLGVDLVFFNGEDYFGANGEQAFLKSIQGSKKDILLALNLDAAGYFEGSTAYSFYGCPDDLVEDVHSAFANHPELVAGEAWYQSDHMIFAQNEVPAMAITSEQFAYLTASITHTALDKPELVDVEKLRATADALVGLVEYLSQQTPK
jgi:aminopeptidase YwaD